MKNAQVRAAMLLAVVCATASCRQILGLEDRPRPCADPLMIDDMEDGDIFICNSAGRHGGWFAFGDGSPGGAVMPKPFLPTPITDGSRGASRHAARFTGSGFTDWGAILGLNLVADDDKGLGRRTYDASNAGGVTFWMKSDAPVTVQFLTPDTSLMTDEGDCMDTATARNCNNPFAFQITAPGSDWKQYKVPFAGLRQTGGSATWKPQQLLGIQFLVGPGAAFDVSVDDLAFYYCATPECVPTCTDPKLPVACPKKGSYAAGCFPPETTCAAINTWCADPLMIDDMEDGDGVICGSGARNGHWWVTSDGTSTDLTPAKGQPFTQTSIPGGRGTSHVAARLAGSGFTSWGAQMGLDLARGPQFAAPYDASAADGIKFWMKTSAPGIMFGIDTPDTIPPSRGGSCKDTEAAVNCDRDWLFSVTAPTRDAWFEAIVPFAALIQGHGVAPVTGNLVAGSAKWDPAMLVDLKFTVLGAVAPFELWIDDIRFFNCSGADCVPTCGDPERSMACPASGGRPASCRPAGADCSAPPGFVSNYAIWGSAANDVWVVGSDDTTFTGSVLHWDGSSWTPHDAGAAPPLLGVSGIGADDLWAVGDHGAVLRRSGLAWSSMTADTDASLSNLWIGGPDDVWVAAYPGTLRHWNGTSWSTGTSVDKWMIGLWGSSPNDVWAVGDGGTILHFDGSAWSAVTSPTTIFLNRVWGSGPHDVWAVSDGADILHFNGSDWGVTMGGTGSLGVWGSASNDVWAVGYGGSILHWNGTVWSAITGPTTNDLSDVWGSGPDDVWAVGSRNTILHFDGVSWQRR